MCSVNKSLKVLNPFCQNVSITPILFWKKKHGERETQTVENAVGFIINLTYSLIQSIMEYILYHNTHIYHTFAA